MIFSIAKCVGDILSVGIFFQLLVCAVSLAVYMYGVETTDQLISAVVPISTSIATIATTYIYCFLSEKVTHYLSIVGDYFYNCAWYRLTIKQQRLFISPIQRAQLKFRITGLGIVDCSLGVFSSVIFFRNSKPCSFKWSWPLNDYKYSVSIFCAPFSLNWFTDYACSWIVLSSNAWFQVKIVCNVTKLAPNTFTDHMQYINSLHSRITSIALMHLWRIYLSTSTTVL